MKRISTILLVIVLIFTSTCISFAGTFTVPTPKVDAFKDNCKYLRLNGINLIGTWNRQVTAESWDYEISRAEAAKVFIELMRLTNPRSLKTTEISSFFDVPYWAQDYIYTADASGIMKGTGPMKFSPEKIMKPKDFITVLLRALGYGYNDSIQEFKWDNALDTALAVGVISQDQYDAMTKDPYYFGMRYGDVAAILVNVVKTYSSERNPYTDTYLKNLVSTVNVGEGIKAFEKNQSKHGKIPDGFQRENFKYFTIWYQRDSAEANECMDLLRPHVDKVYAMLQNLYGIQPALELYLAPGDAMGVDSKYQNIVKNKNKTYVTLEGPGDANDNNLLEFIQSLNMVFYDNIANSDQKEVYTNDTLPWMARANNELITSLYTKYNYKGDLDIWSMYEVPQSRINLRGMAPNDKTIDLYQRNRMMEVYYYSKWLNAKATADYAGCLGANSVIYKSNNPTVEQLRSMTVMEADKYFTAHKQK